VGAGPAISALITFYGLNNLHNPIMFFGAFRVKIWFILAFIALSALSDPSKKDIGGMLTGLMVYQVFKIRI
jgi:hypothetical protein